jgi:hypothetical protein
MTTNLHIDKSIISEFDEAIFNITKHNYKNAICLLSNIIALVKVFDGSFEENQKKMTKIASKSFLLHKILTAIYNKMCQNNNLKKLQEEELILERKLYICEIANFFSLEYEEKLSKICTKFRI